jgi:hypothetical protein
MAEVLASYDRPVSDGESQYLAKAVGRLATDGMWESWIEFVPLDGGPVLVSSVESRQPERIHMAYWATGLTPVYLEGALKRARNPLTVHVRAAEVPLSDAPAPRRAALEQRRGRSGPDAVLDPFEIGARNLHVLRQELGALDRSRLLNIITAYDLNPAGEDIGWLTDAQLVHFIVTAVDQQLPQRMR